MGRTPGEQPQPAKRFQPVPCADVRGVCLSERGRRDAGPSSQGTEVAASSASSKNRSRHHRAREIPREVGGGL